MVAVAVFVVGEGAARTKCPVESNAVPKRAILILAIVMKKRKKKKKRMKKTGSSLYIFHHNGFEIL